MGLQDDEEVHVQGLSHGRSSQGKHAENIGERRSRIFPTLSDSTDVSDLMYSPSISLSAARTTIAPV